jgi:hypothetical protein
LTSAPLTNPVRKPAIEKGLVGGAAAIIYMTKQPRFATETETGRRLTREDEITPAMIAAGVAAVDPLDEDLLTPSEKVAAIYRAMRRVCSDSVR